MNDKSPPSRSASSERTETSNERPVPRFRQKTAPIGLCHFNIVKALQFAAELEDQEIIRKMREGK